MEKIYDIAVIGAGASGLMTAITAARSGASTIVLEHMPVAAKKIPATGNGKCNYTNKDQHLQNYYCEEPDFVQTVLTQFSYADTLAFFDALGIRPVQKNGTCIYPESGQASSVREALLAEIERLHIPLLVSVGIRNIQKIKNTLNNKHKDVYIGTSSSISSHTSIHTSIDIFRIESKEQAFFSRTCILATGGKAAPKTGSDGSGYLYAKKLGHTLRSPLPALVPLETERQQFPLPAGVRIYCKASLVVHETVLGIEQGELQITDYGISGIVIFQLSRLASAALAKNQRVHIVLDFKPDMSPEELYSYLRNRTQSVYHAHKTIAQCLNGFLPDKLVKTVLQNAGLPLTANCAACSKKQLRRLSQILKGYRIQVKNTKKFDVAQVTTGGIPISEINQKTMESKIMPGLYFCGEIIDVDGKCGGYNLQWAWSSGFVAGKHSAAKCESDGGKHSAAKCESDGGRHCAHKDISDIDIRLHNAVQDEFKKITKGRKGRAGENDDSNAADQNANQTYRNRIGAKNP